MSDKTTTAEKNIVETYSYLREAIRTLSDVVINEVSGTEKYTQEAKRMLRLSLNSLIIVRDSISEFFEEE